MQNSNDLQKLLDILPHEIRETLAQHSQLDNLVEVVMDLGRRPEARFPGESEYLSQIPVTQKQLDDCIQRVGTFAEDNRAGIEQTLHRISAIRNRNGKIIGLTCRVGRAIYGTIAMIRDLVETGQSILMLGRPGVGKTTALREIARVLADELHKRVVIIDTSNEIAGDGDIPHPAIGRARRMPVARPELQHQVMIEAVENHMPGVIVIDEIGTQLEALAARTIAERGVQLVGTAHGNEIENLIKNPTLSDLVGGIQSVTLGDDEARRRRTQKTVLERKAPPTFDIAVEMLERQRWVVHESVAGTVDSLLRGRQPNPQVRTINDNRQVTITREIASSEISTPAPENVLAYPVKLSEKLLSFPSAPKQKQELPQINGESLEAGKQDNENLPPMHLYSYGVSHHQLLEVIQGLNLPVVLTRDIEDANAVLVLRSLRRAALTHARKHTNFRQMIADNPLPVYTLKANTIPGITRALRSLLGIEEPGIGDTLASDRNHGESEIEALEEARVAVEQIVIPNGQPVELLPRSAAIRKMQHELVERYRLNSQSLGEEPFRRLRIYPAL
ncbi:single-stranded DNA-binding protein [Nostoc sp. T09]|uniref:R3H domain-containing nucleic acid-binding protein n=1 Tax=Nostoc sp. T09 TaxID=1932621 RepID=UPI000A368215|nr:R3H domain-containing nucleic acid-binding protein [Nostoc sp. T09]OUL19223.1 single-stranded DNA-binding protein [Nostoc sp. T09]